MRNRRLILLGLFLLVAAGMAYFLQDLIEAALLEPVSFLWWGFSLMYQSVAQAVYWVLLVVAMALMAFGSLYGKDQGRKIVEEETAPRQGPLESTARQIALTKEGVYYKWLIANRLGKLARAILTFRNGKENPNSNPLEGRDWDPPAKVESYLESGLMRTFADFPRQKRFSPPPKTPFDVDLNQVLTYLESQLEEQSD